MKYYRLNIQRLGQHLSKYVLYKAMWSGLNNDWRAILGLIQPLTLGQSHPVSLFKKVQQWMDVWMDGRTEGRTDGWMDPRFIRLSGKMEHVLCIYLFLIMTMLQLRHLCNAASKKIIFLPKQKQNKLHSSKKMV